MTSSNFSNVILCSHIMFNWVIKNVFSINHNIAIIYLYIWKKISSAFCLTVPSKMIKQKVYLLTKNLDQLINLNNGFALAIFIPIVFLKPDFNCCIIVVIVFHYHQLIKLQLEHKALYHLLEMLLLDFQRHQI